MVLSEDDKKDLLITLPGHGPITTNAEVKNPHLRGMIDNKLQLTFEITNPNEKTALIKWEASTDPDTQIVEKPTVIGPGATKHLVLSIERAHDRHYVDIVEDKLKSLTLTPTLNHRFVLIDGDRPNEADFERLLAF